MYGSIALNMVDNLIRGLLAKASKQHWQLRQRAVPCHVRSSSSGKTSHECPCRLASSLWAGLCCLIILWAASPGHAQELEPQRWRHLPIDTNFVSLAYIHNDSDISLEPALRIENATMNLDTWALGYTRTFELFDKTAQVQIIQPWQEGDWSGTVNGQAAAISREGFGDTQVRFAIDLLGAPPMNVGDYAAYQASPEPKTVLGVALGVQLPTGEYMSDKLINLGTNVYTFRPEIGFVHERGRWSFEASGSVSIYTNNSDFFGGNRLEQNPLYFAQTNVLYRFTPGLWAAGGIAYALGAETTVNGIANNDQKENILWGFAGGYSITPWLGLKLQYVRSERLVDVGNDSNRYIVSLSTFF